MDDPLGKKVGRFDVEERLGAGGMGEVYRARDPQLQRRVAIKRLAPALAADAELRTILLREARNAARITNQRVAALYDVIEEGDDLYLVMEYVGGTTLRQHLGEAFRDDEFLRIALQCVEGLSAAHRQGIVHGDIKPENIMVGPEGDVKLLDFGVSRLAATSEDATYMTTDAAGEVGGTVSYMAPEILLGHRSDHRADIFALGVVFYEMLTGHHPFRGKTPIATSDRILHETQVPLTRLQPRLAGRLQASIDKMLAKNPDDRYATADDLAVDLRQAQAEITTPPTRAAPVRAPQKERSWRLAAILAAVVLLGGLAWVAPRFLGGADETSAPPAASTVFDASEWVIAVIPTGAEADDDAELAALRDGLAATLTTRLTQLTRSHDLQVVPASALRELGVSGLEAARRELGVTLALDVSVRRAGDDVRVNVGLVDTEALRQLDADTVDGSLQDLIAVEEQVAVRALRMMRIELRPMEERLLSPGTDEPRAHAYYLRGRGYLEEAKTATNVDSAIGLFEQALRVDPDYADAHAGLGRALWRKYELTNDTVWVDRATEACNEAVALDELGAEGRTCLGVVFNGTGRYEEAIAELEEAMRIEPTDDTIYIELGRAYVGVGDMARAEATYEDAIAVRPHYWAGYQWLGSFYVGQGRIDDAIAAYEQAAQLAPDSYSSFSGLGVAYYYAERWAEAQRAFERGLQLNPSSGSILSNLGTLYFFDGRYAESAGMFEQATEIRDNYYLWWGNLGDAYYWTPGARDRADGAYRRALTLAEEQLQVNPRDAIVLQDVARYYAMVGDAATARTSIASALQLAPSDIYVLRSAAFVHAALGEREEAIASLLEAIEGGDSIAEISVDPMFAELRDDPRLQRALEAR